MIARRSLRRGRRRGFTLIEVALATVVMTIGILFCSTFFTNVYEQLSPRGEGGGLRRYLMAEQILKAEAEALRASRSLDPVYAKLVTEPTGANYDLDVDLVTDDSDATSQYMIFDLVVKEKGSGQVISSLSVSTLRRKDGKDAKIGL